MFDNGRRYNAYSDYFKKTFGARVQKVAINAGFSCPNRDGSVGRGGCTYCNNEAFNPSYCSPQKDIRTQILEGMEFHAQRYRRANGYLAFFQAFSNTHADVEHLRRLYNEALSVEGIRGLVIATRPDCIDEQKLELLAQLAQRYYVIVEYGVESCNEATLRRINRGHTFQQAVDAINLTHQYGLKTAAHFIFGLPEETIEEWLSWAKIISALPIDNIKFHQLQIIRGTQMGKEYLNHTLSFHEFELNEYIDFMVDFLERLSPRIVVERFSGEVPPRFLLNKPWGTLRATQVAAMIERRLEERNTFQGRLFA